MLPALPKLPLLPSPPVPPFPPVPAFAIENDVEFDEEYPYAIDVPTPLPVLLFCVTPAPAFPPAAWICGCGDAQEAIRQTLCKDGYFTSVWNKLFHRNLVFTQEGQTKNLFPTDISFGEDEIWLLRTLAGCRKAVFDPERMYHWRHRPGSVVREEVVTPKRLTLLTAKEQSLRLLQPYGKECVRLAQGIIYNDMFNMVVDAYVTRDRKSLDKVRQAAMVSYWIFLCSNRFDFLRKAKVTLLNLLIFLRVDASIVRGMRGMKRKAM